MCPAGVVPCLRNGRLRAEAPVSFSSCVKQPFERETFHPLAALLSMWTRLRSARPGVPTATLDLEHLRQTVRVGCATGDVTLLLALVIATVLGCFLKRVSSAGRFLPD